MVSTTTQPAPVENHSLQTAAANRRVQAVCLWAGPVGLGVFLVGMLMAGILPPLTPHESARAVAHHWASHADVKRAGLFIMILSGVSVAPFSAAISVQIKRIEGANSPLTYAQLGLGCLTLLAFVGPPIVMEVAAFRPGRSLSEILLLNDLAWLPFVGMVTPLVFQCLVIALASFSDHGEVIFPRWLGYFNLWVAALLMPAAGVFFFKRGAFGWAGLMTFWLPFAVLGAWFIVMVWVVLRSIALQAADR